MTFPLYLVLFPYYFFLAIFAIMALIDVYHLARFSSVNFGSFLATFLFLSGTIYILYWTFSVLSPIDFQQIVTTFQNFTLNPPLY
ncbi:MAG: hypothetical protein UX10_C0016G0002 [Candidatus Magasanikbacteria bacterium GW2011_GWA2_45_39]|uniref:Uncharacterized protein n=2 Tax=Candidatus Magasanikiibacteriota TaxID=1752731 RepID=A0A0G1MXQ2_9BACT|nr:MAG: hypothetical protein UX10_C0016G0002 [Candidatus Magasanikbacteria bacterium GW2011_GWA2_45_39]KKU12912.1 MAG: hypothetical protein UX20_C0037G0001 [Candidatus Magasanikbacteria bacterium GW2011_GWC2_45_8]